MNKIFICPLCNREFNRKYNLNQHLKRKNPCKVNIKSNEKLYQNIPKYTTTIPKYTKSYQNIPKQTDSHIQSLSTTNIGYICKYCNRSYKKKFTLNRHLKTCKKKKEMEEMEEEEEKAHMMELILEQNRLLIETLKKKDEELEKYKPSQTMTNSHNVTTNSNNTTNTTNTVNIIVNDYGKEDISLLKNQKYKQLLTKILGNGLQGLHQYIKYKYCNPAIPQNLTIKYTNQRSGDLKVRENNTWKSRNKNEVIDELYDRDGNIEEVLGIYEQLHDLEDQEDMDNIQQEFINDINNFYDDGHTDEKNEKELKRIKKLTLNEFYNNYKENKPMFETTTSETQ